MCLHHNMYNIHIFTFTSAIIFNIVNVTQTTLSKDKPHLSLHEVYCFHASWSEPFFNHLMHFMLPKCVCILFKINFNVFILSGIISSFITGSSLRPLKQICVSDARDSHEHREFTIHNNVVLFS